MKTPESSPPCSRRSKFQRCAQTGVVQILTLLLLVLIVSMLVITSSGDLSRQNTTNQRTADALAQAKEALIGFAANYRNSSHPGEVFGYLPCPDVNGAATEGSAELNCGTTDVTMIGRLPWKTLGLPPLRDGDGECLWYAVSGNFKYNPKTDLMNWDTNGLIEIMASGGLNFVAGGTGTTAVPTMRAAAVIFAPGKILPGQDRSPSGAAICGGNYTAANYLDTASLINNATAPSSTPNALSRFIAAYTAAGVNSFNDRLAFISPDDIFAARAEKRSDFLGYLTDPTTGMLKLAADCIVKYGKSNSTASDKRLPWAAPMTLSNHGLQSNYNDGVGIYSGRLPYLLDTSASTAPNNALVTLEPLAGNRNLANSTICPNWSVWDEFWSSWKDHVFYAVAQAFAPNSAVATNADPCAGAGAPECITVDGRTKIAAVLIFAGDKQTGQSRNTNADYSSTDKSNPANYLEGVNLTSIQQNSPSAASPRQFSDTAGNDAVMCIRADAGGLSVDSTCGAACGDSATALAAYRSGNLNTCRSGTTDKAIPACKTLASQIGTLNCSCKTKATDFISKDCLTKGLAAPPAPSKCPNAYNALLAC